MLIMFLLTAFESHGPLAAAAIHADDARPAAQRLTDLLKPQAIRGTAEVTDVHLVARDLRCVYGKTVWNFDLPFGERIVIRGPSGSGKTTLLETLAGLLPATTGEVNLAAGRPRRTRRSRSGSRYTCTARTTGYSPRRCGRTWRSPIRRPARTSCKNASRRSAFRWG